MRAGDRALRIAMLGLGYVGTTTTACLLEDGHEVVGIDIDQGKLDSIGRGRSPVAEPGVDALLERGFAAGRLMAAAGLDPWLDQLDLAIVCVGTPSRADGGLDLGPLLGVARQLGQAVAKRRAAAPLLLVFRSTVPPGTMETLVLPALLEAAGMPPGERYEVAFNPEFLRQSTAIRDYRSPPKIVIGERAPGITRRLAGLYDGIAAPVFEVSFAVAEAVKLVDNGFHALKVAFANEIGRICVGQGIDPQAVTDVFLADTKLNVSSAYLRPGGPYGGSCLPKDLGALIALAARQDIATPLLEGVQASNAAHLAHLLASIGRMVPPPGPLLQLGLSFKPGTDDLRNSPLVDLAQGLIGAGYQLHIFDPDVEPRHLVGANLAHAALHRQAVLGCLVTDLDAVADSARLAVIGKPLPEARRRLPEGLPVLDISHLRLPDA